MSQSQELSGRIYSTLKQQQPLSLQELAALVEATPEAVRLALADLGADGIRVWADSQGKLSISTKTFPDFTAPIENMQAQNGTDAAVDAAGTAAVGTAEQANAANAQAETATAANAAPAAADTNGAAAQAQAAAAAAAQQGKPATAEGASPSAAQPASDDAVPFDFPSSQERGELPQDEPQAASTEATASAESSELLSTDNAAGTEADSSPAFGTGTALGGESQPANTDATAQNADSQASAASPLTGADSADSTPSTSADGTQGGEGLPDGAAAPSDEASALATKGESAPDLEALRAQKEQEEAEEKPEEKPMTLMGHLNELRWRLLRCFIAALLGFVACYSVADILFGQLLQPLTAALPPNSKLIYTALPEAFFTQMQVAFVAGLFLASPYVFYQIWSFIAPGLYDEEKRFAIPIALASALFFIGGACFCYFIVFPFAFVFFMGFATDTIQPMPSLAEYLSFALKLLFAFGLIFEMPLFTFFLARMGVVTAAMMRSVRRYAILAIFIVAAILTPPDVMSQMLMACPMLLLYEFSILIARVCGRKPKPKAEEPAPAEEQG